MPNTTRTIILFFIKELYTFFAMNILCTFTQTIQKSEVIKMKKNQNNTIEETNRKTKNPIKLPKETVKRILEALLEM